jgi:hypothetical protein
VVSSRCRASAPTPKRKSIRSPARPAARREDGAAACGAGVSGGRVMLMGGILGVAKHLSSRAPRAAPGSQQASNLRQSIGHGYGHSDSISSDSRQSDAPTRARVVAPHQLTGERCGLRKRRRWR